MSDYYTARPNEAKLQEILRNGCNWEQLAQDLLSWLSDDEVGEFARAYEWFQEASMTICYRCYLELLSRGEQVFTAKDYVHDEDGVQCDMCGETIEEGDEIYDVYE